MNAIDLLRNDHHHIRTLFEDFHHASGGEKADIVREACRELKAHSAIEEEIFYPAARKKIDDKQLIEHAVEEHNTAKELVGEIENMSPDDDEYDARFNALADSVLHHIEEEESEMLPAIESTELDLDEIGERMATRREELITKGTPVPKRPAKTRRA